MMAKLTMTDGSSVNIHNLALFRGDTDIALEETPDGVEDSVGRREPDRCEYTLSRKSSMRLRYATCCEIELFSAEVFTLTDFETIRDSHGSPNVRIRSRVKKRGG